MREETKHWIEQAEADLENARDSLRGKKYYLSAFLSQQAAEKIVKAAILEIERKTPPKTHDVELLCRELKAEEKIIKAARNLTPAFILTRYPDIIKVPPVRFYSKEKSEELFRCAEEVYTWAKKKLKL